MKALQGYRLWVAILASLAALAGMVLAGGGCAEKITGAGPTQEMTVRMEMKAGPAVRFLLTVSAADMETIIVPLAANDGQLVAVLNIPVGTDRRFIIEALDLQDVVLYRGESVHDVTTLLALDLTIPMEPVVPLIYLNPHFAVVELGSTFTITVNANGLLGVSTAGIGLSLFNFDESKLANIAFIDTVVLAPAQIERGSTLTYQTSGNINEVFFTVDNSLTKAAIVDELGDGELVIIHCRTQDTWPGETVAFEPQMFIEVLAGLELPIEQVSLDTARFRLERSRVPESYLGGPQDDMGVALINVSGEETVLAGDVADLENEGVPQFYIAGLGVDQQVLWENKLSWPNNGITTGLTGADEAGYFACGTSSFGGGAVSRLDETGNEMWRVELANLNSGSPFALAQRPGGGCVAAGTWSNDGLHFYLAVFDDNGYETHFAPSDFNSNQGYQAVVALDRNTFVAAGFMQEFEGPTGAILTKFTMGDGVNPEWSRDIGDTGDEAASDLMALIDGGFLVVGTADRLSNGQNDMFVTRTDSEGIPRWTRYFGTTDRDESALSVSATPDGNFIAAGSSAASRTNRDVYVVKFNGDGALIWENTLGGTGDDVARDIVPLDSGYLLTGSSTPGPLGLSDILLLRLNSEGKNLAD